METTDQAFEIDMRCTALARQEPAVGFDDLARAGLAWGTAITGYRLSPAGRARVLPDPDPEPLRCV